MSELVVTRVLSARAEQVFDAWLDPALAVRWLFATPGGTDRRAQIDPRVGGKFLFAERRGEVLAEHFGEYVEITRPRTLRFTFAASRDEQPTLVTVVFEPVGDSCRVTIRHDLDAAWESFRDRVVDGWSHLMHSLEALLRGGHTLTIVRAFDAPRELVYRAWTEPELLARWSCPTGFTIVSGESDVRVGGKWRCAMRDPSGVVHVAGGVYRELLSPRRVGFTHAWQNAEGAFGHESVVCVVLAENAGQTEMTFTQSGLKSEESRKGHELGWNEGLLKLAGLLREGRSTA